MAFSDSWFQGFGGTGVTSDTLPRCAMPWSISAHQLTLSLSLVTVNAEAYFALLVLQAEL